MTCTPLITAATCELATMRIHLSYPFLTAFLLEYNRLPYLTDHCISTQGRHEKEAII